MFVYEHRHYRHLKLGEINSIPNVVVGVLLTSLFSCCYQMMQITVQSQFVYSSLSECLNTLRMPEGKDGNHVFDDGVHEA